LIGWDAIKAYFAAFGARLREVGRQAIQVHPRSLPNSPADAQRRALVSSAFELVGFVGLGWMLSGRAFLGILLLTTWGGFWTVVGAAMAITGGLEIPPLFLGLSLIVPVTSAIGCYRTYIRDTRARLTVVA
jgi:hypothetical protein